MWFIFAALFIQSPILNAISCNDNTFPKIGDGLGRGYDIILGNPEQWGGKDPGIMEPIFDLSNYSFNATTADVQYCIPNGVDAASCSSCSVQWHFSNITGVHSYQSELSQSVSGDVSGLWGTTKFSASESFQTVYKSSSYQNEVSTSTKVICCVYSADIQTYTPPLFKQSFIKGVESLPTEFNNVTQDSFWLFIYTFGTHYISKTTMGGKYGEYSLLTDTKYSEFTSSNLQISASAGFSAMGTTAAVNTMTSQQKQEANSFSSVTSDQELFFTGGDYPADGQVSTWIASCQKDPMPITYTLLSLPKLLSKTYFPDDIDILNKSMALKAAVAEYCNYLLAKNLVVTCSTYPPDPPLPSQSIFGGIYTSATAGQYSVVNPYTNGLNCPSGYHPVQIAWFIVCYRCGDAQQFICLKDGVKNDILNFFGGMYQTDVCNGPQFNNPLTGAKNCPAGYIDVMFENVQQEGYCDAHVHWCYNTTTGLSNAIIGGFYNNFGAGQPNTVNNPWTGTVSCPAGFKSHHVANTYGNGGAPSHPSTNGNSYVCLSNIY